ncbi:mediator of RNA polymerase II transcription subunit 24 isoform X2 [Eurytemora carolleeae]|uniref:mediator of RNA polymerase II transcription subunit 24 isoform X2 n=1 Tax=Eurytemora carolleeae TaxID=1294199 RepID=UPI000C75B5B9|nr:mediator of RNA polymerase II transcription subunit 24 isoform X2 [Eurytemora carolleeae]|eukprot:XP_023336460.1 mediator of RNA polymerase II transcription subunit 24-like isoform X2 [Eurytemora affinis]
MLKDKFISSLVYVGGFEDIEKHQDFMLASSGLNNVSEQVYKLESESDENPENSLQARIQAIIQSVRSLQSGIQISKDNETKPSLIFSIQSVLSFDVLLEPTSDLSQLAGQLVVIMNIRGAKLSDLVCELTRCCLLGMNDQDRQEVLRWDAFTLLKLHKLVDRIVHEYKGKDVEGSVYRGLDQLLQYSALLDMTDAKCNANTFDLFVKSFPSELVTENESKLLISGRAEQLKEKQQFEIKGSKFSESRDVTMTLKADSTLHTIIRTFENTSMEQHEFENLLSVMFHIVKGSSFDLLLSAAASNGALTSLVTKLLLFNKGCQESMGESNKVAQNRAALFDVTFLMLVHVVQCFSVSVLPPEIQDGFFPRWARLCMTEPGHVKPLEAFKQLGGEESLVDGLLQQMMQGEIRTQVIKWNLVCASLHDVMKEILLGVEMETINSETYNRLILQLCSKLCCFPLCISCFRLILQLCSKLCCFPICISSWLISSAHFGAGEDEMSRRSIISTLEKFINSPGGEDTDTRPFYSKRNTMMVNILKKMKREMGEKILPEDNAGKSGLSVWFDKVWDGIWENQVLSISSTKEIARLHTTGGTHWFVHVLVEKITSQVYSHDVQRCTEMVFSMLHIDLAGNTLSLLLYLLPSILTGVSNKDVLCYPAGRALAKLTVSCLAALLTSKPCSPYSGKRKLRMGELDDLCNNQTQPVKLRKLTASESIQVAADGSLTQEQLIHQAHVGLFTLLRGVALESTLSPKLEFVSCILEECVQVGGEESLLLLNPLSLDLVQHLIKLQPNRFSVEVILRLFDPNLPQGRRNAVSALCLHRNIRAKNVSES